MNRREFLQSLLSVPFGWKALFKKEVKEAREGYSAIGWEDGKFHHWAHSWDGTLEKHYIDGELVKEWQVVEDMDGRECPQCIDERAGWLYLDDMDLLGTREFTSGYAEWDFPPCEVEPEIRYGQCEDNGARVDGMDVVTGPISDLGDWSNGARFIYANPPHGTDWIPGQWTWAEDICRILAEIIERDVPGMLLKGTADINWDPPYVYIRYSNGPWFMCSDIEADKTQWYRRVEKSSPYSDLLCTYEWELIT